MLDIVLDAVLPMVVTFLLGFVAAWRGDFGPRDASPLNRMVLVYAVPLALFAGTVTTSRRRTESSHPAGHRVLRRHHRALRRGFLIYPYGLANARS
jgi:hypothetical protein